MTAPNEPRHAILAATSVGDNTIIAAVTGRQLVVWKIAFTIDAAGVVQLFSGASPTTPLSGAYKFTAAGTLVLEGPEGFPLWRTIAGDLLNANVSAGNVAGDIWFTYE